MENRNEMGQFRVAIHNLGCKVNAYEADAMASSLKHAGFCLVDWEETADIYIINTCSVTNIADRKSRQMLHKAKSRNEHAIVVGVGCYVQARYEELKSDTSVDILIGNNKKAEIAQILRTYIEENGIFPASIARTYVSDINKEKKYEEMHVDEISGHARAFIKVQDGCNQFCTYCIIPHVRGRIRSRKKEEVRHEVETLVSQGFKEVVLTGIHLSSYGLDFDEMSYEASVQNGNFGSAHLLDLIQEISSLEGVERIRLGSLEPRIITDSFAQKLAENKKICPHFHLSLQSGCNETLKRMNRHYTTEDFLESCKILRRYFSDVAITTDVITGFPGETEEEFAQTEKFVETIGFYEMHVFKYSRRAGTVADKMAGQLTDAVKSARSDRLLELEEKMSKEFRIRFVGKKVKVLVEEIVSMNEQYYMTGFTENYVKVLIPCSREEGLSHIGEILSCSIREICKNCLLANE